MANKNYRGIQWNGSNRDLSLALGLSETAAHNWLWRHPDKNQEDYIDHCLNSSTEFIREGNVTEDNNYEQRGHWICESCGTIKYGDGWNINVRKCKCGGKACLLDGGMVPILKVLHSKGYKTHKCCQGHYRYEPALESMVNEQLYISFMPVDILDSSDYFAIGDDCKDALSEILCAANKGTVKVSKLNKDLNLNFEWSLYNEIYIGAIGPFGINKSHSIQVRYQGEYDPDNKDDVEKDLVKIRDYLLISFSKLDKCKELNFMNHSKDNEYHVTIVEPEI